MTKAQNNAIVKAYLEEIENAKYYAIIYTGANFANCYLDMSQLTQYDVWIADWRGFVGYKGNYGIWQHSNKGKVNGISRSVDLDVAYKDYPTIIRGAGLNRLQSKPVAPVKSYIEYVVKKGDSFWKIAHNRMGSGLKMWELAKFNNLKITSTLYHNQKIKIPK